MTNHRTVLVMAALVLAACSSAKEEAKEKQAPAPREEPSKETPSPSPEDGKDSKASRPKKDAWPLPEAEPSFIGFSSDGALYAVRERFGHEQEPGFAPFWVDFIELRDVRTQKVVKAFQAEPFVDEDWGDQVKPEGEFELKAVAFWESLPPKAEADAELAKLGIAPGKHSLVAPDGATLEIEAQGKAPKGSRFKLTKGKDGYDFRWDKIKRTENANTETKTLAPRMTLTLTRGDQTLSLLTLRPSTSYEEMQMAAGIKMPYLTGSIRVTWDAKGHRAAIAYSEEVHDQHEEYGPIGRIATYLRTFGAQIKVIDAGAGPAATSEAVAKLEAEGYYVTVVETADKPEAGTTLYFRGTTGGSTAQAAGALLPSSTREELTTRGWVDLIAVLGTPRAPGDEPAAPKCELVPVDMTAGAPAASKAESKKLLASLNKEYEESAGGVGPLGRVVKHGEGYAYPMVECDGSACNGYVVADGKSILVPALLDGIDGTVEFKDFAVLDIDDDGHEEAIVRWTNMSVGGDDPGAGMKDVNRLAVVSLATRKVQLVHSTGACSKVSLQAAPAACPNGTHLEISCGRKSQGYQRRPGAAKYVRRIEEP